MRTPEGLKNVQEELDSFAVGIRRVFGEVVERVPEAGLPQHLQRRSAHPSVDIDFLGNSVDSAFESSPQLWDERSRWRSSLDMVVYANLVRNVVEDVRHMAQMSH